MEATPQTQEADDFSSLPFSDEVWLSELREARDRLHTLVEKVQGDLAALREERDPAPPARA